ncbi:MAG: hypothetical protein CO108_03085 [Deltaproteobacteria bacterium CG_4_9_14_3_um_filter_63_12]|nr:MAG: hypothetical protein CO108_03085 [Deltaproteobacteria bacterium CG_4_9_14_3_um_filter_63_12]
MRKVIGVLLAVMFAAGAFVLGSTFIYLSSLEVSKGFDLIGQDVVLPGFPALFRGFAHSNSPAGPLQQARLELSLRDGDQLLQQTAETTNGNGETLLTLPIPKELKPGQYTVDATLLIADEAYESASFTVSVRPPSQRFTVATPAADQTAGELRVEMFVRDGAVVPHLENQVFVRVTDRQTYAPVAATVELARTYGDLLGEAPTRVETDRIGLAEFTVVPITPTDWVLNATTADERRGKTNSTLPTLPAAIRIDARDPQLTPNSPLEFEVQTVRDGGRLYWDLLADGAWLSTHSAALPSDRGDISWLPAGLGAPTAPRLVEVVACFSPIACDDANSRVAFVWLDTRVSPAKLLEFLAAELAARPDGAFYAALDALSGSLSSAELHRANHFAASQLNTVYHRPQTLVRSEEVTAKRLEGVQENVRNQADALFALLLIAGVLCVTVVAFRMQDRRRKAMWQVELESEFEEDEMEDAQADHDHFTLRRAERRRKLASVLEITALVMTILVFAGGIWVLLSSL